MHQWLSFSLSKKHHAFVLTLSNAASIGSTKVHSKVCLHQSIKSCIVGLELKRKANNWQLTRSKYRRRNFAPFHQLHENWHQILQCHQLSDMTTSLTFTNQQPKHHLLKVAFCVHMFLSLRCSLFLQKQMIFALDSHQVLPSMKQTEMIDAISNSCLATLSSFSHIKWAQNLGWNCGMDLKFQQSFANLTAWLMLSTLIVCQNLRSPCHNLLLTFIGH